MEQSLAEHSKQLLEQRKAYLLNLWQAEHAPAIIELSAKWQGKTKGKDLWIYSGNCHICGSEIRHIDCGGPDNILGFLGSRPAWVYCNFCEHQLQITCVHHAT